jgi:uncharacterized membrane protein
MIESLLHNWLVFAILASFLVGLFSFVNKISVERDHSEKLSLIFLYVNQVILSFLAVVLFGNFSFDGRTFLIAVISGSLIVLVFKSRFFALKYLDSAVYFTNFRIFSSTMLLFVGILFFGDELTVREVVGFILGIIIFLLLIDKNRVKNREYKKAMKALLVGIIGITLFGVIMKLVSLGGANILNFIFYQSLVSFVFTFLLFSKDIFRKETYQQSNRREIFGFSIFQAFVQIINPVLFLHALSLGADLGIAYKVLSYSILIPIMLAILFYKEKVNKKKVVAFVLTIISLWFFV